jgi:hypothetical protein
MKDNISFAEWIALDPVKYNQMTTLEAYNIYLIEVKKVNQKNLDEFMQ